VCVDEVSAEATRPLRQRVLRPHQRAEDLVFPGDADARTLHLAALEGAGLEGRRIVGVASWMLEPPPGWTGPGLAYRLRGMATAPEVRGGGAGALLLDEGMRRIAARGAECVWCQARIQARGFYARFGFAPVGEVFELPAIGPHVAMERRLLG